MAASKEVSVDAAIASLISEMESISSLKEERQLKAKFSPSACLAFVSLIDRWFIQSLANYFSESACPFSKQFPMTAFHFRLPDLH